MDRPLGPGAPHEPIARALVQALLDDAGRTGPWVAEPASRVGWINSNTTIRLADGERVVARRYDWPFEESSRYDRRDKEAWLLPILASAGVPVATVLGRADLDGERATLLEWLPGAPLGVGAPRLPTGDLDDAWREAGVALRRAHAVAVPDDVRSGGFLHAGWGRTPFPGDSFGGFHQARIARFGPEVAARHPEVGLDLGMLTDLAGRSVPVVDRQPLVLAHNDAHAWNVLVAPGHDGRWHLSGWLDWEMAAISDPAWDLARIDHQRFAPIGPTPSGLVAWLRRQPARDQPADVDP